MSERVPLPSWLKVNLDFGASFNKTRSILEKNNLNTVCTHAFCPNISDCWHKAGTATFMILGITCTRNCRFCGVRSANKGDVLDVLEPSNIAFAVRDLKLKHVILTSVDRDDLPDFGAGHFALCIKKIKEINPEVTTEVLIPDFSGREDLLKLIVSARPDVVGHNVEVVERLQSSVRDRRANYVQSLFVLESIKKLNKHIFTKSSLMLGLGESFDEVVDTMRDLRGINCDFLTIGQYLMPSKKSVLVVEYVHPDIFNKLRKSGLKLGFKYVFAGPLVRSSYMAGAFFDKYKK